MRPVWAGACSVVAAAAAMKSRQRRVANAMPMNFELLDGYLLRGTPDKATVVSALLADPAPAESVRAHLEGLRILGTRTPDLALIALRLAGSGKRTDDADVVRARELVERARHGGSDGDEARRAFGELVG